MSARAGRTTRTIPASAEPPGNVILGGLLIGIGEDFAGVVVLDQLAGLAADSQARRVAAQWALADLPLAEFLNTAVVPYETDEVTRLIQDTHDAAAFAPVRHLTVGGFREWLLSDDATTEALAALAPGLTPEMAAATSKLCRLQDLMVAASRARVVTRFRGTVGLPGRLSTRLQPNHPADDPRGIAASVLDGLLMGAGDAVIGVTSCAVQRFVKLAAMASCWKKMSPHRMSAARAATLALVNRFCTILP